MRGRVAKMTHCHKHSVSLMNTNTGRHCFVAPGDLRDDVSCSVWLLLSIATPCHRQGLGSIVVNYSQWLQGLAKRSGWQGQIQNSAVLRRRRRLPMSLVNGKKNLIVVWYDELTFDNFRQYPAELDEGAQRSRS